MNFLYVPECLLLLVGRDLFNKSGAQVTFDQNKIHIPQNNAWEAEVYVVEELSQMKNVDNKEGRIETPL